MAMDTVLKTNIEINFLRFDYTYTFRNLTPDRRRAATLPRSTAPSSAQLVSSVAPMWTVGATAAKACAAGPEARALAASSATRSATATHAATATVSATKGIKKSSCGIPQLKCAVCTATDIPGTGPVRADTGCRSSAFSSMGSSNDIDF